MKMIASQLFHTIPQFQDHPAMFQGNKLDVKQEPMDDVVTTEAPVDMSMIGSPVCNAPTYNRTTMTAVTSEVSGHPRGQYNSPHQQHYNNANMLANISRDGTFRPPTSNTPNSQHSQNLMMHPDVSLLDMKTRDGQLAVPESLSPELCPPSMDQYINAANHQRAKREFVPDNKKDEGYWSKRFKNNDSARRSRVKRKALENLMSGKLMNLQKENIELRYQIDALRKRFSVEDSSDSNISVSATKILAMTPPSSSPSQSSPIPCDNTKPDIQIDNVNEQRPSSGDSISLDDSRLYPVGNFNHMLGFKSRDRADSISSSSSSSGSQRGKSSCINRHFKSVWAESQNPRRKRGNHPIRMDESGALDLSENSNRSSPTRDMSSPESCSSNSGGNGTPSSSSNGDRKSSSMSSDSGSGQEDWNSNNGSMKMKGFPLKCRWKREQKSSNGTSSPETDDSRN